MDRERAVRAYKGTYARARSSPIPARLRGPEPGHGLALGHCSTAESGKDFMSAERADKAKRGHGDFDLSNRIALRPREAADALGLSERKLRELLPELPTVRRGNIVLIPVAGLLEWLRDQSRVENGRVEKAVTEILEVVHPSRKD